MSVAVVIPAFNASMSINATLASVVAQTCPPDQVVVVDDGSTDGTASVASTWRGLLPLQVISQSNAGPAAARRRAIAASDAPLIALVDADDIWLPNHLERLTARHDEAGGIISANGLRWRPGHVGRFITHADRLAVPPPAMQPIQILRRNFVFVSSVFARSDYELVDGFRDGWSGAEDWDLWIQMIRNGVRVSGVKEPTCMYRLASTSLTHSDGIVERYLAVLRQASVETVDPAELTVIERSIRRYEARAHFGRALDAARPADARREARRALRGPVSVASQAAALLVAPRTARAVRAVLVRRRWG